MVVVVVVVVAFFRSLDSIPYGSWSGPVWCLWTGVDVVMEKRVRSYKYRNAGSRYGRMIRPAIIAVAVPKSGEIATACK